MIEEVFQTIKGSINKQYFGNSKFYYNKSATTGLYSLMVESTPSLYHLDTSAHLFARVKLSGKLQYISFSGTTLIISKKPGNTGISRDIRTEFTTDLLLSD